MLYEINDLVKNPPKRMAELFGLKDYLEKLLKKNKLSLVENNKKHYCKMCGRVQEKGILDLKNNIFGSSTNDFYDYVRPNSYFVCESCFYLYKNWKKNMQKSLMNKAIADTANIIVYNDRIEEVDLLKTSKENKLYALAKEPPKEAFMLIIKKYKSISAFDVCFNKAVPTIDSELFVLNNGFEQYYVPRYKILEGCKEALKIYELAKTEKVKLSKETLLNSSAKNQEDYLDWLSNNVRNNDIIFKAYLNFINKYDEGARFAISMVYESFLTDFSNRKNTNP